LGRTTAERILPDPSVAFAYSDSLWRLPFFGWFFRGLNVLFLSDDRNANIAGQHNQSCTIGNNITQAKAKERSHTSRRKQGSSLFVRCEGFRRAIETEGFRGTVRCGPSTQNHEARFPLAFFSEMRIDRRAMVQGPALEFLCGDRVVCTQLSHVRTHCLLVRVAVRSSSALRLSRPAGLVPLPSSARPPAPSRAAAVDVDLTTHFSPSHCVHPHRSQPIAYRAAPPRWPSAAELRVTPHWRMWKLLRRWRVCVWWGCC
jgi:hypothetical protein